MVTITREIIDSGMSSNGGWNNKQLKALGVPFPLTKGWMMGMIGKDVPESNVEKFIKLKNAHIKTVKPIQCPHCKEWFTL